MATITDPPSTLYLGYGSNLWQHQMSVRCPSSVYIGVARLRGYRWIINARGFANVVECPPHHDDDDDDLPTKEEEEEEEVYGLVYRLTSGDEAGLDKNEGVPWAYTKEIVEVEVWDKGGCESGKGKKEEVLLYIDRKRMVEDQPREEYVGRMNMGIRDAVERGVPRGYVEGVLRRFIPEEGEEEGRVGDDSGV